MADAAQHDLFLSYRRLDAAQVQPLVDALRARGLRVWQDVQEIESLESIQQAINAGLARSRALLVWYSTRYNESRACQWELTTAYLAAQADAETAGDPRRRVLVVNPEASGDHIVLPELFDQQHLKAANPINHAALKTLVKCIESALRRVPNSPVFNRSTRSMPHWFPYPRAGSKRFVGRLWEMWHLHSRLETTNAEMHAKAGGLRGIAQVRGPSGCGKTLFLEEYALRFGSAYPGGIYWLRASDSAKSRNGPNDPELCVQLINICRMLGLCTGSDPDYWNLKATLRSHFEKNGNPYLWIVENIPHDIAATDLGYWFPPSENGKFIISSNCRRFGHLDSVEIQPLSSDDAYFLLTRGNKVSAEEEPYAQQICQELGNFPLAIDVFSPLARQRGYANALAALGDADLGELEFAGTLDEELPTSHSKSICLTVLSSLELLDANTLELLRLCIVLADEPVPRDLVIACWEKRFQRCRNLSIREVDKSIDTLVNTCLGEPSNDCISIHLLIIKTIQTLEGMNDNLVAWYVVAFGVIDCRFSSVNDIYGRRDLVSWIPHARAMSSDSTETTQHLDLLGSVLKIDIQRGDYEKARLQCEVQVEGRTRLLGPLHPATLASRHNLALCIEKSGDTIAAIELLREVLQIRQRELGGAHIDTLSTANNLGTSLHLLGRDDEAIEIIGGALETLKNCYGEDHESTLVSATNYASIVHSYGRLDEAMDININTLRLAKIHIPDRLDCIWSLKNNIAAILQDQGKFSEALPIHEEDFEYSIKKFGEDHPETILSTINLSECNRNCKRFTKSRDLATTALEVAQRTLNESHHLTISAKVSLASALQELGDLDGAITLLEDVTAMQDLKFKQSNENGIKALNNLAIAFWKRGDRARSISILNATRDKLQQRFPGDHPLVSLVQNNLRHIKSHSAAPSQFFLKLLNRLRKYER